ncbi:MAG: hypothetical protein R2771_04465 [Saprospiraceae bacterium]
MKKINFIYGFVILAAFAISFASCTTDTGVPPTLSFGSGSSYISGDAQVDAGEYVTVKLNGTKGDADMNNLTIYEDGSQLNLARIEDGVNSNPVLLSGDDVTSFTKEITFTAQESGSSEYLFVLTDVSGLKDSVSFLLSLNPETAFNLEVTNLKVYNADGPAGYYGSVDLQKGVSVASDDTDGDVQDLGINNSSTGWAKTIEPENGTTMFIPPSSVDYDDVTSLEKLLEAMDASTQVSESTVSVGDLFILKSPSPDNSQLYDYFILKTTEIHDDGQVGPGYNQDYYIFSLKRICQLIIE